MRTICPNVSTIWKMTKTQKAMYRYIAFCKCYNGYILIKDDQHANCPSQTVNSKLLTAHRKLIKTDNR